MGRNVLITGASSGIGKALAFRLLGEGWKVFAVARRISRLNDLKEKGAIIVEMDLTNEESVINGIARIQKEAGTIDILINNAGYGEYGSIEEVSTEVAKKQFEVNVFGLVRITRQVLPQMRENRYGKIINISSMAGKATAPMGGWYHASKHAVEALSDALRMEVRPFGIDVIVIEPGAVKSEWADIAKENLLKTSGHGPYIRYAEAVASLIDKFYAGSKPAAPEKIADVIIKAIAAKKPSPRYVATIDAKKFIFFKWLLTDRMFDRLLLRLMKVSK
ncbi:MAG: oxidoreductase [Victivallaceae bacterium]|jgi:short-subunit dehydrogenase